MEKKRKPLAKESEFVDGLVKLLSDNIPAEERKMIDDAFSLDYGGLVNFINRQMERTIKAIKHRYMTIEGFTDVDARRFERLCNCDKLDAGKREELRRLIFDEDERAKYLEEPKNN